MKRERHILIVDEPSSLLKLGRVIDHRSHNWKLTYVSSGQIALDVLHQQKFDAVITQTKLSEMDGDTFLEAMSRDHPLVIRFLVIDGTDHEGRFPGINSAHQVLSQICAAESLETNLKQVFELDDLLGDEKLLSLLTGMTKVPSLPAMYQEIRKRLQSPHASIREIAEIIHSDPAMTAKIIKLVNSAYFGLNRKVTDAAEAASLIGLDTLSTLVLSVGIFSQFDKPRDKDFSLLNYVQHSLDVANLSKRVARVEGQSKEVTEAAFLAGILHDMGMLILMQNRPEDYKRIKSALIKEELSLDEAEAEVLGANHGAVGAYLLGLWGLPTSVIEAVAFHHQPSHARSKQFGPLTAVHVACTFSSSRSFQFDTHSPFEEKRIDLDYLSAIGMADKLQTWQETSIDG